MIDIHSSVAVYKVRVDVLANPATSSQSNVSRKLDVWHGLLPDLFDSLPKLSKDLAHSSSRSHSKQSVTSIPQTLLTT